MTILPEQQRRKATAMPLLSVVGAGIGDPDLITLKAVKALRSADVVLYDALANEVLLDYAPTQAIRLYVGKRRNHKAFSQPEINTMIVEYARQYGHVVRLKGGDPFVFGRGWEEMDFARRQGIPANYIPGISSAIAAPAAAGIPVTLRGVSRSFWVVTATTESGDLNPEIRQAAATDATLVVLMGLSKLPEIAAAYAGTGKMALPLAVIQNAGLPDQRFWQGNVAAALDPALHFDVKLPGVIVVGEVASRQMNFDISSLEPQTAASYVQFA